MNTEQNVDPFTEELRLDLPNAADEARLRGRLISAGVLAGAAVAPAAAGAATATSGGLFAKLAALPLIAKVGAGVAVVAVAAVPVVARVATPSEPATRSASTMVTAPVERTLPVAREVAPGANAPIAPIAEPPADQAPAPHVTSGRDAAPRAALSRAPESLPAQKGAESPLPSVGSFAVAPEPVDEGTLRAETALMERALAAMERGDFASARRDLALHAQKFPRGHLAPERERALERMLGKERKP